MSPTQPGQIEERLGQLPGKLRPGIRTSRVLFQDAPFYVLHDSITRRTQRLPAQEYRVLVQMISSPSLSDGFASCCAEGLLTEEDRQDYFQFAATLTHAKILLLPQSDGRASFKNATETREAERRGQWMNFLFLRIPMFRPNALLDRTAARVQLLFTRRALLLWILAAVASLALAFHHRSELAAPLLDLLALENLPWLGITLIVLKAIHELGHGYACKIFGGEVPEMGVILIVGTPCAYVDASAAWSFPSKARRVLVSLAGMYFESICGMVALMIWLMTGPGLVNTIAYQACVLATVTTILFNINPLMKFDGYFVLADLLDLPNLRQVSHAALRRQIDKWLLRIPTAASSNSWRREVFLSGFGISAAIYKVVLVLSISTMIATQFAALGIGLAGYYVLSTGIGMVKGLVRALWLDPRVAPIRWRARFLCALIIVGLPALVSLVPVRLNITAPGVIRTEREAVIRAEFPGTLTDLRVRPGSQLLAGEVVAQLENLDLVQATREADVELEITRQQQKASAFHDRVAAGHLELQAQHQERRATRARERVAALYLRSPFEARVLRCVDSTVRGNFVAPGDELALVGAGGSKAVVFIEGSQIGTLAAAPGTVVEVRSNAAPGQTFRAVIDCRSPRATRRISDLAVTQHGGGPILASLESGRASAAYFEITLQFDRSEAAVPLHGTRITAQFDSAPRTLAQHGLDRLNRFLDAVRKH